MYNSPYSINYLRGIVRVLLVYSVVMTKGTLNVIGPNIFLEGDVYQLIHFRYTPPPGPILPPIGIKCFFNFHSSILALYIYVFYMSPEILID